ncbi:MAG: PKD domain-containing protein [Candidatus Latescibacterota bacterium]
MTRTCCRALRPMLLAALVALTACEGERPTPAQAPTGSVRVEVLAPDGPDPAGRAGKVPVVRGKVTLSGPRIDADIVRTAAVSGGRLTLRVDEVPVGPTHVVLALQEESNAVVWEGAADVTVAARQVVAAVIELQAVGDARPQGGVTVEPQIGKSSTNFVFRANVDDRHDATEVLEVRWDFNDDGIFDTQFSQAKEISRAFPTPGTYTTLMEVRDRGGNTSSAQVQVEVQNSVPVAVAGQDITRDLGQFVRLDAHSSTDPDGSRLTYRWTQTSGPSVALDDPQAQSPVFQADRAGTYSFRLVVNDGIADSEPDEVVVTIVAVGGGGANTRPLASAGQDRQGVTEELIRLDGRGSTDPEGNPLTYQWVQMSGPAVVLQDPGTPLPGFIPTQAGQYTFSLVVSDGSQSSVADEVVVTVTPGGTGTVNSRPVAAAYAPGGALVGEEVYLLGDDSQDPDGDVLYFFWEQVGGPAVVLGDADMDAAYFTATQPGQYVFQLVVNDGEADSQPVRVTVTVTEGGSVPNIPPVADARGPAESVAGELVTLDGSLSYDADGGTLYYDWLQLDGPLVALTGAESPNPSFLPTEPGEYVFELVVDDGTAVSMPVEITVRVTAGGGPGPGGPRVVFASLREGTWAVYATGLLTREPRKLTSGYIGDGEPDGSPEGGRIAFASGRDNVTDGFVGSGTAAEIYVMDAQGGSVQRLTYNDADDREPSWSPDGNWIAFTSNQASREFGFLQTDILVMDAYGNQMENLTYSLFYESEPDWSPDGSMIAYGSLSDLDSFGNLQSEVYVAAVDGSGSYNLTQNEAADGNPDWSADGQWMAFSSNRGGQFDVYVLNLENGNLQNLTQGSGGNSWGPAWGPEGNSIAFVSDRAGSQEIYLMDRDGRNQVPLTSGMAPAAWPSWLRVLGSVVPIRR